jgi:probable HAF family extracellular repeat protein
MQRITHPVLRRHLALCGLLMSGAVLLVGAPVRAELAELYSLTALGSLGGTFSKALGINAAGQVVGQAETTGGAAHAFVFSNGTMTDLGTLGGTASEAHGINMAGQVVGRAETTGGAARAFVSSNGTMTDLGTLGGTASHALGINTAGQVVGRAHIAGDAAAHAFVSSNGTMTDLGTLGGTSSQAHSINAAGEVVGQAQTTGGAMHAFVSSNGTMTNLGTLGGTSSYASGINAAGEVVGASKITGDAALNAFLYKHGALVNLNSLLNSNASGWTLEEATAINDNRQIVGYGLNPLGQRKAFLLTPVPLPSAVLLFGSGLIGLVGWQRKCLRRLSSGLSVMRP